MAPKVTGHRPLGSFEAVLSVVDGLNQGIYSGRIRIDTIDRTELDFLFHARARTLLPVANFQVNFRNAPVFKRLHQPDRRQAGAKPCSLTPLTLTLSSCWAEF